MKILIAGDQNLFSENLRTFLNNRAEDMLITGIASTGDEAVDMSGKHRPDVILMDIQTPETDGPGTVKRIKALYPEIKIIMLSTVKENIFIHSALKAGASGFLPKDISPTALTAVVRALDSGVVMISSEFVRQLFHQHDRPQPLLKTPGKENESSEFGSNELSRNVAEWLDELTHREREIFILLASGYDNDQIAEKYGLAVQTVRNQVSTIYSKIGVKDRFEIIQRANGPDRKYP